MQPAAMARTLTTLVLDQLAALEERLAPGWRLPGAVAGHAVGADVRADLAFTLTHLAAGGTTEVGGRPVDEIVAAVLRPIDGAATHTFFSYRVAESVARHGPLAGNPLVAGWTDGEVANLAAACDSTDWIELLDGQVLPANYAAVLARCELGRAALGLPVDTAVVDDLLARTGRLLAANPLGFLDDDPRGGGRYDIYSVDLYLFCEPFAHRLPTWAAGVDAVAGLVEQVAGDDGSAVTWGRSTGLLALCHTLELTALVVTDPRLDRDRSRWAALAQRAIAALPGWFADGLTTSHQHRSPYGYRGPERRLQLTLDALGKLAWTAARLATAGRGGADDPATAGRGGADNLATAGRGGADNPATAGPEGGWTAFETARPLGVWAVATPHLRLALPVVGTPWSDYLPAPHQPGTFETPVDRPLGVATPMVHARGRWHAGAGVPAAVEAGPDRLDAAYEAFPPMGGLDAGGEPLAGSRQVTWRVDRRTLHGREHLRFEEAPAVVSFQVCETADQPLVLQVDTDHPHTTATIDTAGMKEWRSYWGELPRVHQVDLAPATEVRFDWSLTPVLRVATDAAHHWYHRSLYDPMAPWVADRPLHRHHWERRGGLERLRAVDVYHLHWPEWTFDTDADAARRFVALLAEAGVRLVWTQHNLWPHRPGDFTEVYAVIAAAADGVIHHSEWGRDRALATRRYHPAARHVVIPHGHWGALATPVPDRAAARARVEAALDLAPCALRIGIVGAPRPGKDTTGFIEAFARSRRADLGLLVLSLDPDEVGVAGAGDPRLRALPYEEVDRATWDERLAALDLLAFPFLPEAPQLTTGVVADAVAAGLPSLITSWGFLAEVLGDAGLPMGDTPADWTEAVEALDPDAVAEAAAATAALRDRYDWSPLAATTRTFLEDVAARSPGPS